MAAGGCRGGGGKWLGEAEGVINGGGKTVPGIRDLHAGGSSVSRSAVDDLLKGAPKTGSDAKATKLIDELRVLANFDDKVKAVVAAADKEWHDVDDFLRSLVDANTAKVDPVDQPTVADRLAKHGKSILNEAACDLAWQQMQSAEQKATNAQVTDLGYRGTMTNEMPDLGGLSVGDAQKAIVDAAWADIQSVINRLRYPAALNKAAAWYNYAKGLLEKATRITDGGTTRIAHLNNAYITNAYVYYARKCLAPPA
jgi:hypothetical protein